MEFKPPESEDTGKQSPLEVFRAAIAAAGLSAKGYEIRLEELTDEDALMWRKVTLYPEGGGLTRKEFMSYRDASNQSQVDSRRQFAAYLSNLVMVVWQQLPEGEQGS